MVALARAGAAEGSWLRAEHQTGGRGRHGRAWIAAPGNLYASTLVRVRPGDPPAASLALVAAVALDAMLVPLTGPERLKIKWPNDLMLDGRKLSGILLERIDDAVVIGFGVNLLHAPEVPDRPTTSLAQAGVARLQAADVLEELASSLVDYLARWRQGGVAAIAALWQARAYPPGTAMRTQLADGSQAEGLFDGLDDTGGLRLRMADGRVETILAGDVFLV